MRAAIVTAFGAPPRLGEMPAPEPGEHELVVDVVAAGLHPRVHSQADGSHYTSTDELPLVPGVDGVGRDATGALRYFLLPDTALGSMAERTVIDAHRSIELPEGTDAVAVAAAMNPAMSSWVALRSRAPIAEGARALVLGATGSAGSLAVQIARRLGASHVIAAGRDAERLAALADVGADELVSLAGGVQDAAARLAAVAADVDVIIDYVWGPLTSAAMTAIITARTDRAAPLTWIEIGSLGGRTAEIPSAALRAARLQIVGSGQGSVPTRDILAELPALAAAISAGEFALATRTVPLAEVEHAFTEPPHGAERVVIVP